MPALPKGQRQLAGGEVDKCIAQVAAILAIHGDMQEIIGVLKALLVKHLSDAKQGFTRFGTSLCSPSL